MASTASGSGPPPNLPPGPNAPATGPTAPVLIACQPCRRRKVRCDAARPACSNCIRRNTPNDCVYDAAPRRRGPDKNPGTRQRPTRKKTEG
uniref:Zn(2)-C6 fungal-type domain-containing protein n=1 Tax=Mycena chlorophos TaxID=658473 RepID=A0ABQ0M1C5_MYCCL|nr:predicted protein [Mycena chlorophos]